MSPRTITATSVLAMHAVTQHALNHQLPAPRTIDAPRASLGETRVQVWVDSAALDAWIAVARVVEEIRTTPSTVDGYQVALADVLVPSPIGDVAVTLRATRPVVVAVAS